jgi:RNA polymerase sigma factor (sigma-70 family)
MSGSQVTNRWANSEREERLLLDSVAERDRDAFTELYGIYQARLFKFVYRLTRSYTASEELVNDIMLVIWRNAGKFRGDSKPSTWIFGIAYRQTLKRLSKKQLIDVDIRDCIPADPEATVEKATLCIAAPRRRSVARNGLGNCRERKLDSAWPRCTARRAAHRG